MAMNGGKTNKGKDMVRWRSSYGTEEVIFYRLTKAVAQGEAIQNGTAAIGVVEIVAKWMALFTAAFTAFEQDMMGQLDNAGAREEMESARAAFVALLLAVCENPVVLKTMGKPYAKSKSVLNFPCSWKRNRRYGRAVLTRNQRQERLYQRAWYPLPQRCRMHR
jgi:mediator of RNA polymerase II transcription subunit 5